MLSSEHLVVGFLKYSRDIYEEKLNSKSMLFYFTVSFSLLNKIGSKFYDDDGKLC